MADVGPPTIGAAMRFIISAPAPSLIKMGINDRDSARPVIRSAGFIWGHAAGPLSGRDLNSTTLTSPVPPLNPR